jgi:hypothetical protein
VPDVVTTEPVLVVEENRSSPTVAGGLTKKPAPAAVSVNDAKMLAPTDSPSPAVNVNVAVPGVISEPVASSTAVPIPLTDAPAALPTNVGAAEESAGARNSW